MLVAPASGEDWRVAAPPWGGFSTDATSTSGLALRDSPSRLRPSPDDRFTRGEQAPGVSALLSPSELVRVDETLWEIPAEARPDMRVPARIFADRELLDAIVGDQSLEQLQNVATLPGIVDAALAMPDIHQGYGFPVGGVAAMELPDGVVSPGGVGYDINCGVRLLALPLSAAELGERREPLVHELSRAIPAGTGKHGPLRLSGPELDEVLREGPRALVARGDRPRGRSRAHRVARAASRTPIRPRSPRARTSAVPASSARSGAGNHFIELQRVDQHLRPAPPQRPSASPRAGDGADPLGLARARPPGLHRLRARDGRRPAPATGSCSPTASSPARPPPHRRVAPTSRRWRPPPTSPSRTGTRWPTPSARRSRRVLGPAVAAGTRQVYDVAHNVAKVERHGGRDLLVHRKGATRAFPAGSPDIPADVPRGRPARLHSRAAWAPRASSSPASRGRWSARSARPATAPAARCPAPRARKRITAAPSCAASSRRRGSSSAAPRTRASPRRRRSPTRTSSGWSRSSSAPGLARRVARLVPLGVVKG